MSRGELAAAVAVVISILRQECGVEGPIGPESDLQRDCDLDSLGMLTLLAEIENHYRMVLDESPQEAGEGSTNGGPPDPPTTVLGVAELIVDRLATERGHNGDPDIGRPIDP